jgi:hypothetical protein
MKKGLVFFFLIFSTGVFAQIPNWKVLEPNFQYTMTLVAKVNVDGVQLSSKNDIVSAFVGTSCRGVSELTYVANEKAHFAYLTVFSNTPGELITFYVFNSAKGVITKIGKPITFTPYQNLGNLFQSYSIAEPALSNKAELLSFDFLSVKSVSSVIIPGSVKVTILEGNELGNLTPIFTLSKGANLFKNRLILKTSTTADSFTGPVTYEVLSEDESTLSTYTVNVTQIPAPPLFYKKDVVCTTLGAIKVVSKREGSTVNLSLNGKPTDTRVITNGEASFLNLASGTYVATIGTDSKVIVINIK